MSEIKGQLLGIILAIALFGIVFGVLTTAFRTTGATVASRMNEVALTSAPVEAPGPAVAG